MSVANLLQPFCLRGALIRNRIGMAPMCMYTAGADGCVTNWHLAHYQTRATGTGLVIVEATSVSPSGRVTPQDLGLWSDTQIPGMRELAEVIAARGALPGVQLSHSGRKGSRTRPWDGDMPLDPAVGGWEVVGPVARPFAEGYATPRACDRADIAEVVGEFALAAVRAVAAGFRFIEVHAAHGRLIHSFLSPEANDRRDDYGGCFTNRIRLLIETVSAIRASIPAEVPLGVRLSCTDWTDTGWALHESVQLAVLLRLAGVDLIDCTSGGIRRPITVPVEVCYQVTFAEEVRRQAEIATAAVGCIPPGHAAVVVDRGQADIVLFGRAFLASPHLALQLVDRLDSDRLKDFVPPQYARALTRQSPADHIPEL